MKQMKFKEWNYLICAILVILGAILKVFFHYRIGSYLLIFPQMWMLIYLSWNRHIKKRWLMPNTMNKLLVSKLKDTIIALFTVIIVLCLFFICCHTGERSNKDFNKEHFLSKGYSNEEISIFCDIGFLHNRVRKWETDIKVEIIDINSLDKRDVDDVDSIIKILTPLIYPLRIYRVENNGNLKVYRRVKGEIIQRYYKNAMGITKLNPCWDFCVLFPKITHAEIYVGRWVTGEETLFHEFLHAIGLTHPSKQHKFYLAIAGLEAPNFFNSIDEWEAFDNIPYYISEQEKQVIKMLYSSGVKSGLKREVFIKEMGIDY